MPKITALKCYACGGDGKESCDLFTVSDSKFVKDCEAENQSCRFERSGKAFSSFNLLSS